MPERRTVEDPWYTALYKEPHTLWWAPAVAVFVIWMGVGLLMQNDTQHALVQAAALSAGPALVSYIYWRRKRR